MVKLGFPAGDGNAFMAGLTMGADRGCYLMKLASAFCTAMLGLALTMCPAWGCGSGPHPHLVIPHVSPHAPGLNAKAYREPDARTLASLGLALGLLSVALVGRIRRTETQN